MYQTEHNGTTWTAVTPPPNCAITYNLYGSTNSGFTPSSSNLCPASTSEIGATKFNFYQDVVISPSTKYYCIVQASNPAGITTVGGPVSATTLPLGNSTPFWDATNIPPTPLVTL